MLVDVLNEQQQVAKSLLTGEVTAAGMPDLATNAHAHHEPAANDSPSANAWADPVRWDT